jgi:hypothetical protein
MVKLLVFAILLASSPVSGLIETLLRAESGCYAGCHSNYAASAPHLDACRKGCDFKLHNENCAIKCLSISTDEKLQSSCQVGCTLNHPATDEAVPAKPVDSVPANKEEAAVAPSDPEPERHRSIILIRLRQRPSFDMPSLQMPSVQTALTNDPMQFFNNIIKQFQEKANQFDETLRKSFEQNSKDLPKPDFGAISELVKKLPLIPLPGNVRADSSSESSESSSEEQKGKRPLLDEFKHVLQHPRDHQQYLRERAQPIKSRVQQFFTDVRSEWNDLVRKQPKIPIWIFLGILLSSSAILWYMVMSLCRHTPSRNALSIRAQELVFHPYEYDAYEKEKIQPDDQPYEVTESLPIKVKLSNI